MNDEVGGTAGRVWAYLAENGQTSIITLKSKLEISNSLLCMALGWLAREDKVNIEQSGHTYSVSLK